MIALLLSSLAQAVPVEMNHQGRLLDTNGAGLQGTQYLTITLYDSETAGTIVYTESLIVDCQDGYYSTSLGVAGMLDSEVLEQYPLFLDLIVTAVS